MNDLLNLPGLHAVYSVSETKLLFHSFIQRNEDDYTTCLVNDDFPFLFFFFEMFWISEMTCQKLHWTRILTITNGDSVERKGNLPCGAITCLQIWVPRLLLRRMTFQLAESVVQIVKCYPPIAIVRLDWASKLQSSKRRTGITDRDDIREKQTWWS